MTAEQEARDMLDRMGVPGAQEYSAGDLVELANMINVMHVFRDAVIDRCDRGHQFVKLRDHPMRDGHPRCPYCLAEGLDACWKELAATKQAAATAKETHLSAVLSFIPEGVDELLVRRIWERVLRSTPD